MPVKPEDIKKAFQEFASDWLSEIRSGVVVLSVVEDGKEWLWNYKKKKVDVPFPRVKRKIVEARGPFRISVVDAEKLAKALQPKGTQKGKAIAARTAGTGVDEYVALSLSAMRGKRDIWTEGAPTHLGE